MRIVSVLFIIIAYAIPTLGMAAEIDGQDGDARFPEGEIVFQLDKIAPDNPKPRFNTLSIGYMGTHGEFDEYLTAAGYTHPEPLHNDFKVRIGYLRFIRHIYFKESMEFTWGMGLAHSSYQLTSSVAGNRTYFEDKAIGLHGQVGLAYHLTPMIAFQGNLDGYLFASDNSTFLFGPQIQFILKPIETLRLHAGIRSWFHSIDFNNKDLEVHSQLIGPSMGITLYF